MAETQSAYNYKVVRQFTVMAVIWGVVGMLVGVIIAAQLVWPDLNIGFLHFGRLRWTMVSSCPRSSRSTPAGRQRSLSEQSAQLRRKRIRSIGMGSLMSRIAATNCGRDDYYRPCGRELSA